jgi:hypothetical protein
MTLTQKCTLGFSLIVLVIILILFTQSSTAPKQQFTQTQNEAETNETKTFLQGTIDSH